MTTLSWNCRGMGNPRTVREIKDLISRFKPKFVFLMEVESSREKVEKVRTTIGFEGLFFVKGESNGAGLAFLWKERNTTRLIGYSKEFH